MITEKRLRKLHKKRLKVMSTLGIQDADISDAKLIDAGLQRIGGDKHKALVNGFTYTTHDLHTRFDYILSYFGNQKREKRRAEKKKKTVDPKKFYLSYEWRKARYAAIVRNNGCCEACGLSKKDGITLHVDHIKPLRFNWELRTDPNNLQVLCELCNHGKGNWDQTDWREPNLRVLMGEEMK